MQKLGLTLGSVLFFLMVAFPSEYKEIKIPIIALLILGAFYNRIILGKKALSPIVFYLILIIVVKGIIWTLIGLFKNNPGTFAVIYINVIWYIFYGIFISQIINLMIFNRLIKVLMLSALFIVLFDLAYILMSMGIISYFDPSLFYNKSYFAFVLHSGFTYLVAENLNNLVFIFPFTVVLFIVENTKVSSKYSQYKYLLFISLILEVLLMLFSGRRVLYMTLILTPIYISIFAIFLESERINIVKKYLKKYLIFGVVVLFLLVNYLLSSFDISLSSISTRFSAAFSVSEESTRFNQANILIDEFMKSPLIGHGAGAEIAGYSRSKDLPWAFELSYYDDLFKTGLLGISLFLVFIIGIVYQGIKVIKIYNDIQLVGLMAGMLSFLVANSTNPFLSQYDFFWPVFLPIAYINMHLVNLKLQK